MSGSAARFPARPSLEQLRKQAKEHLHRLREGAPATTLADAQLALAREYGFESWPKLVYHVEALQAPSQRLAQFEQLARDVAQVYRPGNAQALQRLADVLGISFTPEEVRAQLQHDLTKNHGADPANFGYADAQRLVARQYGFGGWDKLVESIARPPSAPRSDPLGLSTSPPFYKIDRKNDTLEPRPPLSDNDWDTIFSVMKELGITGLDAGGQMTDAAMARLPQLDHVTRLSLGGSKRLTDTGLQHLARMPQLEKLDLSGWEMQITDAGLEGLRHLRGLRDFQACWSRRISDAGVANLTFCDHLEVVNLLGSTTGDGAINALTGKRKLHHFSTGRLVTDRGLPLLHEFPVFKTWQGGTPEYDLMGFEAKPNTLLLDGPFTDAGVAGIARLDGLFGLSFFWHVPALSAAGLEAIRDLPNLGFLGCQGELCNDDAMRHIAAIPRLRMLMGQGTVASDAGFVALSRSQSLEYLWGRECPNLGGRGFAAMAAMPGLLGLAVSCKNVDDAALSALPRFRALRQLMPMDVTDAGFRHVGRCADLEDLWCMYCRDTGDTATGHIAGLSKLRYYYAGSTRITDRSMEILGRMSSLERLEFRECRGITDAGVAHLAGLPRLRTIALACPNVTRDGAAVFPSSVHVDFSMG